MMIVEIPFLLLHNSWQVHFVETNLHTYSSGHNLVIVSPGDSTIGSILFALISKQLIQSSFVSLSIQMLTHAFHERRYDYWLGSSIGAESIFLR